MLKQAEWHRQAEQAFQKVLRLHQQIAELLERPAPPVDQINSLLDEAYNESVRACEVTHNVIYLTRNHLPPPSSPTAETSSKPH